MLSLSTAESQAASIPNQVGRSLQSHREEHPMLCTGITTTTRQPAFYILAQLWSAGPTAGCRTWYNAWLLKGLFSLGKKKQTQPDVSKPLLPIIDWAQEQ